VRSGWGEGRTNHASFEGGKKVIRVGGGGQGEKTGQPETGEVLQDLQILKEKLKEHIVTRVIRKLYVLSKKERAA